MSDSNRYDLSSKQPTFFGLTKDTALKGLFGGNAFISIIVLGLITLFLFKEGAGFFGQYRESLTLYRKSGLEYVNLMRDEQNAHASLTQFLNNIQSDRSTYYSEQGMAFSDVKKELSALDGFIYDFEDLGYELESYVQEMNELVMNARDAYQSNEDYKIFKANLEREGRMDEAANVVIAPVDLATYVAQLRAGEDTFLALSQSLVSGAKELILTIPSVEGEAFQAELDRFKNVVGSFFYEVPSFEKRIREWDRSLEVGLMEGVTSFIFGREWITGSAIQDWYGVIPLLGGSLTVAGIAMFFAVPLGVGAAIYVNQVANPKEQAFIKPYIEFISAIPSVVIGFFGIAIFGEFVRFLTNHESLSWISFFPISERLNAFTAGALLALMAIPTIFTLAEDALNNVPKAYKEASSAMGATRLQTILRIMVPTALSGIISAVLLGFGRVIGETMVVLLCAGNRIALPDFTKGLGAAFEPVHTMTGIIAQELGEVEHGSIHYRALFMIGLTLFCLSLLINYVAQKIVIKYQISRG